VQLGFHAKRPNGKQATDQQRDEKAKLDFAHKKDRDLPSGYWDASSWSSAARALFKIPSLSEGSL
jgi:hypothetical protein